MVIHVADAAGNMTIGLPSHVQARVGGDAQMLASSMGSEGKVDDGAAGAVLGGFGIRPFVRRIERSLQLVRLNSKGSDAKPREPISLSSFSRFYLLARTFRRQHKGQVSAGIQSVGVLVGLFGFLRDETPGANPASPIYYNLGFVWGVSSSLMVNAFKFGCDLCFRDVPRERELSKRFEVFSRQARVNDSKKGVAICGVTSRGTGYVKT
jgi:hypothetical protein